ncbi:MAG: hypothetical protein BJ554DRAFT_7516, partial [Olpidium bornovanus]
TLTTLDVCGNRIEHIRPLRNLDGLQHLDLSDNNIRSWEDVSELLERSKNLRSLCIAGNPVSRNLRYRQKIILLSSSVSTVDNKDVNAVERQFLRNWEAMGRKSLRNITESKFERSAPGRVPGFAPFRTQKTPRCRRVWVSVRRFVREEVLADIGEELRSEQQAFLQPRRPEGAEGLREGGKGPVGVGVGGGRVAWMLETRS